MSDSQKQVDLGLLIELVQRYEYLYNLKHKKYKNNRMKQESWREIARIMDLPVEDVKKHWKSIRDKYKRQKRAYSASGSAAPEQCWEHMQRMSFYAAYIKPRKTYSATPAISVPESHPSSSKTSPWSTSDEDGDKEPRLETPIVRAITVDEDTPKTKRTLKRKHYQAIGNIVEVASKLATSIHVLETLKTPQTQNETFCQYILSSLNSMDPDVAMENRKKMICILEDLRD